MMCLKALFLVPLLRQHAGTSSAGHVLFEIVNTRTFDRWKSNLPRGLLLLSHGPLIGLAGVGDRVAVRSYGKFERRH
jgi:hypothetical protein